MDAVATSRSTRPRIETRDVPIKVWATLGALILGFEIWVVAQWITGPYFTPVLTGPTPIPGWMLIALRAQEAVMVCSAVYAVWRFVLTPLRRDGRMSNDGLMCLGILVFGWFLDPVSIYGGPAITYNAYLYNMGSWLHHVPGVLSQGSPGRQLPEPILWGGGIYLGVIFLVTALGAGLMRKMKERFPGLTPIGLFFSVFPILFLIDAVLEGLILVPLGAYTYAGTPGPAINADTYYKFPFFEALTWGLLWTAWSSLLYYKDDKGLTFVERGVDELKLPQPVKTFMRFLAIGAFIWIAYVVLYIIPWFWIEQRMSEYPEDIQQRSYFLNGMCGEGTTFSCPGPSVPTFGGNRTARITPEGELHLPEGAQLPKMVPWDRGEAAAPASAE